MSFEDLTIDDQNEDRNNDDDQRPSDEEEKTLSSGATQADGRDIEINEMEMHSDFGFDTSTMFGQLKRKTPLIKPEVSSLLS